MARNTNIQEQLFPVWRQPIYLENQSKPVVGFKAIVGNPESSLDKVFSIVSDNYILVTNEEALNMGKTIHQKLFPNANTNSFEIFNVVAPKSKSFCHIDIIDKNYTLNIWKQEVYVPFVRIHNSYNKVRSLKFDIGFCRKLCDNGVIFEQDTINLKFAHTKEALNLNDIKNIDVQHLKMLEKRFTERTRKSSEIKIPRKFFLPLAAKALDRNFQLTEKSNSKKIREDPKFIEFASIIDRYSERYINIQKMGETAYAFFNVITDYASNNKKLQAGSINGLQTKCGMWVNSVGELVSKAGFNWEVEIKDYLYLMK